VDDIARDRESDSLSRHRLIGTHAAFLHALRIGRSYARTVIFYAYGQPRSGKLRAHTHLASTPFARIVEHVAEHLEQIGFVPAKAQCRIDLELCRDPFVCVDFRQCLEHALRCRPHGLRRDQTAASRRGGALQVIADDAVHPVDLFLERVRELRLRLVLVERAAHERERSLQTVRQIGERIAIALLSCALVREQRVQVFGDAPDLARVVAVDLGALAVLEL
jgi:hypothetical protein